MPSLFDSVVDLAAPEPHDPAEWRLTGWATSANAPIRAAHLELAGSILAPLTWGWDRVLPGDAAATPCGFSGHLFLPGAHPAGPLPVQLVFLDEAGGELGRVDHTFVLPQPIAARATATPVKVDASHPQSAYLDLLERTLLALPYSSTEVARLRHEGRDWPEFAHSMVGLARLRNLRACAETALREGIPGDFMETGVWRGGACILLRGVLRAFADTRRRVWVADSFDGLPPPNPEKYPADRGDTLYRFRELAVPLAQVQENFRRYDLLDDQVRFLEGLFSQTLPTAPVQQLAVLRLDGDLYESTMDALVAMYPRLSPGGFCIVDDYGAIAACRQAVHDYRRAHGITAPIGMVDWTGAWWRKP